MDVIIVCHTEFGRVINKKVVAIKDHNGFQENVFKLMELSNKYNAKVTFMICPEVASYFPKGLDCEIGLHIHPGWQEFEVEGIKYYVGDEYLKNNCQQSSNSTVLKDYSFAEQFWMIQAGIKHLIFALGRVPQSFVAGRWSINNDTVKALIRNSILRDCSAVAHSKKSHYDWSKISKYSMPYHPSEIDYQVNGDLPILEIPISQLWVGANFNPEMARLFPIEYLKANFKYYYIRKLPLFHMCLHLPCMQSQFYIFVMDELLKYISQHDNINFKFVSDISEYKRKPK